MVINQVDRGHGIVLNTYTHMRCVNREIKLPVERSRIGSIANLRKRAIIMHAIDYTKGVRKMEASKHEAVVRLKIKRERAINGPLLTT